MRKKITLNLPPTVAIGHGPGPRSFVNISRLPAPERRQVWAGLQAHEPGTAALLQDPVFVELKARFGGSVLLDRALVNRVKRT